MELRQLRYFVAVAEELNFRRAAERLHIAQPSLSQQIMALERELGAALLLRDSKHVELTEAGRALLPEARRTLEQARRTRETARRAARGELGTLRVGHVTQASPPLVRRLVEEFRRGHPDIEVRTAGESTAALVNQVADGEVDIAFVRMPVEVGTDLETRVIERDPMCAALAVDHPLATREFLRLQDMDGVALITSERDLNPWMYDHWFGRIWPEAGVRFSTVREESSLEDALSVVADGNWVCVVPSVVSHVYGADGIRYVPFRDNRAFLELGVVWRGLDAGPVLLSFLKLCDDVAAEGERASIH